MEIGSITSLSHNFVICKIKLIFKCLPHKITGRLSQKKKKNIYIYIYSVCEVTSLLLVKYPPLLITRNFLLLVRTKFSLVDQLIS